MTSQSVAVWSEGEGAIHPAADACFGEFGKPLEALGEFVLDPLDVLGYQVHAIIPRRAIHAPVLRIALVDAQQQGVALLPCVREIVEIHQYRQFAVHRLQTLKVFGDEVVVLHRRHGKVDAGHQAQLFGPKSSRIDHMLGMDRAFLGDHIP